MMNRTRRLKKPLRAFKRGSHKRLMEEEEGKNSRVPEIKVRMYCREKGYRVPVRKNTHVVTVEC